MVDRSTSPQARQWLWRWSAIAIAIVVGTTLFIAWPTQRPVPVTHPVSRPILPKNTAPPVLHPLQLPIRVYNADLGHIRFMPDGVTILVFGSEGTALRSQDDGQTWNTVHTSTNAFLGDSAVDKRSNVLTVVGHRGTLLRSDATAARFTRIAVNTEHNFHAVAISTDGKVRLAIGDAGVAYVSRDDGQSFQAEQSGSTHSLTLVQALPKRHRFVVGGDQGTLLLRDEPGTWQSISLPTNRPVSALSVLPDGTILVGTLDGLLLRSSDDGETWIKTNRTSDGNASIIAFESNPNASILLARTKSSELLFSSNKGKQFQPLSPELKQEVARMAWMPGRGFVGLGVRGDTLRSDGSGKHWKVESTPRLLRPLTMAIHPKTRTLLVVGRSGLIARSTEGGKAYQMVRPSLGSPLRSLADNSPAGCLVAVGLEATVLRSTDEGDTWERVPLDIDPTIDLTSVVVEPKTHTLLAGGTRGTLLRSENCARTWTAIQATHETVEFLMASEHLGLFALVSTSAILRSLDAGLTFTPAPIELGAPLRQVVALSSSDLVAVGDEGRILRSTTKGQQFQVVPSPTNANLRALAYDPVHRSLWVAGQKGTVLVSRDDGESWSQVTVPTEDDLHVVTLGPNGSQIWFGGNGGTVLHSTNSGVSFTLLPTHSTQPIRVIAFDPPSKEFFLAGTGDTLYRSVESQHPRRIFTHVEGHWDAALFYKPTGAMFLGGHRLVRIDSTAP